MLMRIETVLYETEFVKVDVRYKIIFQTNLIKLEKY